MAPVLTSASAVIEAYYVRPIGTWPNHSDGDYICLPHQHRFISPNEYYSTAFHELVHWSEVRLKWTGSYALGRTHSRNRRLLHRFARQDIPTSSDLSNHAAYLQGWLKELESDPKAILRAASQASKATEFVLSFSQQPEVEGAEAA